MRNGAESRTQKKGILLKIRQKGLRRVSRTGAAWLIHTICTPLRRLTNILLWIFPTLGDLFSSIHPDDRRLLAIYDLSSQPFSIGDILAIQEASLVLRENHHLNQIDFALVYTAGIPNSGDPVFRSITEENVLYHLASVLPAAQVNQHHGSLFVFNSHKQLQRFISAHSDLYHVWPPALKFAGKKYLYYEVFNDLLYNYYRKHGTIPFLSCRPHLVNWAEDFYRQHACSQLPVTVQVRNNKHFHQHRNLRLETWLEFFKYCEQRYPVKFIVICAFSEIDDRLRQCSNIIIAKDYHTTLEQDLALIHTSAIHMGASSGPACMAIFSPKPYLIVNTDLVPNLYRDTVREGHFLRYFFAGPLQRFTVGVETVELLIEEFTVIWNSIDVSSRTSVTKQGREDEIRHLTWLR